MPSLKKTHNFIFIRWEARSYVVSNPESFAVSSIEHISPWKPLATAALTKVMICNTATWLLCVYCYYRDTVKFLSHSGILPLPAGSHSKGLLSLFGDSASISEE